MVQQSRLRSKCHSWEQAHARLPWKESSDIPTLTGVIDEAAAVDSGLSMRGLKKARLSKSESYPNANDQAVKLFDCAFTSLKVEAHSEFSPSFCVGMDGFSMHGLKKTRGSKPQFPAKPSKCGLAWASEKNVTRCGIKSTSLSVSSSATESFPVFCCVILTRPRAFPLRRPTSHAPACNTRTHSNMIAPSNRGANVTFGQVLLTPFRTPST